MTTKQFTITSEVGLHARPATILVQEASKYNADIELVYKDKLVNVKSIMGLMALGLSQGETFTLQIEGDDAESAMAGIEILFNKEGIATS